MSDPFHLHKLLQLKSLNRKETQEALEQLLQCENVAQTAAFLSLLHAKQETAEEISGAVTVLQQKMREISLPYPLLDIVGTGGDQAHTVNISTGAAIIAAAMGVKVMKHGNRSVSSLCGSADILELLGVDLNLEVSKIIECVNQLNIGFCFAPRFHPVFKNLKNIREQLGFPTIFNLLGPLLNPAKAKFILLGVNQFYLVSVMGEVLEQLGIENALIFHSQLGIDELTSIAPTHVLEINRGSRKEYLLKPDALGFVVGELKDLQGGYAQQNAQLLREALSGKLSPILDTLILNAAAAAYIYGITDSIQSGIQLAKQSVNKGQANELLNQWINFR